jgi:hypothetical protein
VISAENIHAHLGGSPQVCARTNDARSFVGIFPEKCAAMFIQADTASWGAPIGDDFPLKGRNFGRRLPNSAFARSRRAHYHWGALDANGQVALCRSADFRYKASRIIGGGRSSGAVVLCAEQPGAIALHWDDE